MEELIKITDTITEGKMTSLQIAEATGKRHDHVLRDIRKLLEQGVSAPNFGESSYLTEQNKVMPMFSLTKKGCLILASGYNALLREKIINRWEELELLFQEQNKAKETWNNARQLGKPYRRIFTDAIQTLVTYAMENGSKNAGRYYTTFTVMMNNLVGCDKRESANTSQLGQLMYLESMIANVILLNISQGVYYKDIYKHSKQLCEQIVSISNNLLMVDNIK